MRALQFGDSVLPVGSFSFSNGLETAVAQRVVRDIETLRQFVANALEQAARSDGIALLEAHRGAVAHDLSRIVRADAALMLRKLNEEIRTMNTRMGRKLGELAAHVTRAPLVARWVRRDRRGAHAGGVRSGHGRRFRVPRSVRARGFRGAPIRRRVDDAGRGAASDEARLSRRPGDSLRRQRIAEDAYANVAALGLDDIASFAPQADILAAMHVDAHVRMFMS